MSERCQNPTVLFGAAAFGSEFAGHLISYRESKQTVRFHPRTNLGERGTHGSAERDFSSSICPNVCRVFIGTPGAWPRLPGFGSTDKTEHRLHPGGSRRPLRCGMISSARLLYGA